jgi:N utilization substance protein B
MTRRSKAREVVLQMLYQIDVNPDVAAGAVRDMIREQLPDEDLHAFAWSLFAGVRENRAALDARISTAAENWTLTRMAPTDRNALRLGAFELLFTETPLRVVIDETIELARRFGTAQSPQFVNGILDKLVPPEKRRHDIPESPDNPEMPA